MISIIKSHVYLKDIRSNSNGSWLKCKLLQNLTNLSVADSGSYSCQAVNVVGKCRCNASTRPVTIFLQVGYD